MYTMLHVSKISDCIGNWLLLIKFERNICRYFCIYSVVLLSYNTINDRGVMPNDKCSEFALQQKCHWHKAQQ